VFGCEAYVIIRRKNKEKLDARAERAVHLGVSQTKKAWVLFLWSSRKIIESRNVYFYENVFPFEQGDEDSAHERRQRALMQDDEAHLDVCDHGEDRVEPDDDSWIDDRLQYRGGEAREDTAEDGSDDHGQIDRGGDPGGDRPAQSQTRRSRRVRFCPLRFDEIDYDNMAKMSRQCQSARIQCSEHESSSTNFENEEEEEYHEVVNDIVDGASADAMNAFMTSSGMTMIEEADPNNEREAAKSSHAEEWAQA
jgi:hypothetical protein